MQNSYSALALNLARQGFFASTSVVRTDGGGLEFQTSLANAVLKHGRIPRGSGQSELDALKAANAERLKYQDEEKK